MAPQTEFIPTSEVAALFRVTETTVKRWANDGLIECVKSPGGHRRFRLADVIRFAERQGHPVSGILDLPLTESRTERLAFALDARNYHAIAGILFDEVLRADPGEVFRLLHYLSKHNVKFPTLADEILRPPMVRIGELWEAGKVRIDQEHRASRAVADALVRLAPELHRRPANGLRALCTCAEGERHELGLRSMAYALETEGWEVDWLGADTPYDSTAGAVRKLRPSLLCVSFTKPEHDAHLRNGFSLLAKAVRAAGVKFIAGGYHAAGFTAAELHCDHVAASVAEGISWIRDEFSLRPGPKKLRPAPVAAPGPAGRTRTDGGGPP